jgi:hypothetical protein
MGISPPAPNPEPTRPLLETTAAAERLAPPPGVCRSGFRHPLGGAFRCDLRPNLARLWGHLRFDPDLENRLRTPCPARTPTAVTPRWSG